MPDTILKCFVQVRRNFADFPFATTMLATDKAICVERTRSVLEELESTWIHYPVSGITPAEFERLTDAGHMHRHMPNLEDVSAFVRSDDGAVVYVNMQDHVVIRFYAPADGLETAAKQATDMAQLFAQRWSLAKNERLGWLTSKPILAGTGLQAGYIMHLPMLNMMQQVKGIAEGMRAKQLFSLEYQPEQEEKNPAALWLLQTQFSAYDNTRKLLDALREASADVIRKEENLREKIIIRSARSTYVDQVFRAYGILKYARRLTESEFLALWSKLRLGVLGGLLELPLERVDALLEKTKRSALLEMVREGQDEHILHFLRADLVRAELNGGT